MARGFAEGMNDVKRREPGEAVPAAPAEAGEWSASGADPSGRSEQDAVRAAGQGAIAGGLAGVAAAAVAYAAARAARALRRRRG
jgi:hypothetical protein